MRIDHSKLQMRGDFGIAVGSAVIDQVLLGVALDFDNQVMRKMLSISPNDLSARLNDTGQVLVATKVDGEGTYVYFERDESGVEQIFAFSTGGRVRVGFPALTLLRDKLMSAGIQKTLLRCELCLPLDATKTAREGVAEVIRVSFSGAASDLARLKLVLLDVVMLDGKDLRANQNDFAQTLSLMQKLVGSDAQALVHCMCAEIAPEREIGALFARLIAEGHEGIVVRRLNRAEAWKIKPHRSVDAVIIGYVEGSFEHQFGVTSLLTALCYDPEDSNTSMNLMQTFARVGSGLKDEERVAMLDQLRPLKVPEPIAMTDSSGRAVHFIRPELVVELHGEDIVFSDSGKPLRTQLVQWNTSTGSYAFLGLTPCPRMTFATYAKLRPDKNWRDGGARSSQIAGLSRPALGSESAEVANATPQVIRREVYVKGEMLRKLVVLHQPSAGEFPYLLYWTDFSAKRAEPLKVSLEIAANAERATQLAERMLAENLAKGWVRV
jgi:hypothetical protein